MNLSGIDEWYMKMFGWRENPFVFKILPELFVGYNEEVETILNGIRNGEKFMMLLGPTGSGKTTFLKYLINNINTRALYLPKPPRNPNEIVNIMKMNLSGRLGRIFSHEVNLYNLSEWMNKKLGNRKVIIIMDESHEAGIDTLEWMRTITDQVDNISVIMAGLPVLEEILQNKLETLMKRVNIRIELTNLTKTETRELIKRRIEYVGGDDIKPFVSEAISLIYERTNGFPREVLRMCNEMLMSAYKKGVTTIDTSFISDKKTERRIPISVINNLPAKQKDVLNVLKKYGELTPTEIVNHLDKEEYKSYDNAIRSVNNILRRLMGDGLVDRKRYGKAYKYTITGKIKTMLVED